MSARLVVKKDTSPEKDVEDPRGKRHPTTAFNTNTNANANANANANPASNTRSARCGAARNNPVFLAGAILRKVFAILATLDEDDVTRPGGIVCLLKDIVFGVFMGVVLILVATTFLDHREIAHVRSVDVRVFRSAGAVSRLLNDPETIATMEELSDLKLMTLSDYETKRKKIDKFAERKSKYEETLKNRQAMLEEKTEELEEIRNEHDGLMNHPLIELNEFCGDCVWVGKTTCDRRMEFLQVTYHMRPIEAKMSAMEVPTCKKRQ